MTPPKKTIVIIGLGYVGLPLAVEFGKYRATLGLEINQTQVNNSYAKEATFAAHRTL